jgi:hypothetical protein
MGRHGTAVAGIRAMRRHVHASVQPRMTKRAPRSSGLPDLAFVCVRNPTGAPKVWRTFLGVAGAFRSRPIAGFARARLGRAGVGLGTTAGVAWAGVGTAGGVGVAI